MKFLLVLVGVGVFVVTLMALFFWEMRQGRLEAHEYQRKRKSASTGG